MTRGLRARYASFYFYYCFRDSSEANTILMPVPCSRDGAKKEKPAAATRERAALRFALVIICHGSHYIENRLPSLCINRQALEMSEKMLECAHAHTPRTAVTLPDETTRQDECGSDPTAKWGPKRNGHDGPFAIAFAGGLRNFLVKVIPPL